ncbi:MAG: hypothetical protein R6V55_08955 [Desulfovermiculus sp.]
MSPYAQASQIYPPGPVPGEGEYRTIVSTLVCHAHLCTVISGQRQGVVGKGLPAGIL